MPDTKMQEQLISLRKQKGLTQEELAKKLGVTNQAVSKWESGSCCPDISLLPDIANIYGVSIDTLFGRCALLYNFDEIVRSIKSLFAQTPEADCFDIAFRLSFYLHEGACTKGYRQNVFWDVNKERKDLGDFYRWGSSSCNDPEGTTIMKDSTILVSSNKCHWEAKANELISIQTELQKYADVERLIIFFALYELTHGDFNVFVEITDIVNKSNISEDRILEALKWLPIRRKKLDNGNDGYRIEDSNMHIPILLGLFIMH